MAATHPPGSRTSRSLGPMHPGIVKCELHGRSYDPKRNKGCPLCFTPNSQFSADTQSTLLRRAAPLWLMSLITLGAAYMVVIREPPPAAGAAEEDEEEQAENKADAREAKGKPGEAATAKQAANDTPDGATPSAKLPPELAKQPKAPAKPPPPKKKKLREADLTRELATVEALLEDRPKAERKATLVSGLLALSDAVRDRGEGPKAKAASDALYQAAVEIQTERKKPRAQWRRAKRALKKLRSRYLDR